MFWYLFYIASEHPLLFFSSIFILTTSLLLYTEHLFVIVFASLIVTIILLVRYQRYTIIIFVLAGFLVPMLRVQLVDEQFEMASDMFEKHVDSMSRIEGIVYKDPKVGHSSVDYPVKISDKGIEYHLLIRTQKFPRYMVGDLCSVDLGSADVQDLKDGFKDYLSGKNIVGLVEIDQVSCFNQETISKLSDPILWIRTKVYFFKDRISDKVERIMVEPHASLLLGMIFGDSRLFDDEFEEDLRITGTTHIIAASGFNVAILHKMVDVSFGWIVPKKFRAFLSICVIWIFAFAAELSGSILRATVMLTIFLVGKMFGRVYRITEVLLLSSMILLFFSPYLIKDVGFLLSVGATLGLILFVPVFEMFASRLLGTLKRAKNALSDLLPTVACTLGTIPVSYTSFDTANIFGILPNLFLLPMVEYIYFLGLLSIAIHMVFGKWLSIYLFNVLYYVLDLFIGVIGFFGDKFSYLSSEVYLSEYIFISVLLLMPLLVSLRYKLKKEEGCFLG